MARDAKTYEAYYLCRLQELEKSPSPKKTPQLTTAQANFFSKRKSHRSTISRGTGSLATDYEGRKSLQKASSHPSFAISAQEEDGEPESPSNQCTSRAKLGKSEEQLEQEARIKELLCQNLFFKDLGKDVLNDLSEVAEIVTEPAGLVIFRGGDPPSNCYLMIHGQIGFYVGGDKNSPRKPTHEGYRGEKLPDKWDMRLNRVNTREGWSTYAEDSNLGKLVGKAGPGKLFGELALMDSSKPRAATAKCLAECELLVVHADAFNQIKERAEQIEQEKRYFLGDCIPGVLDEQPVGTAAYTFYFQRMAPPAGHVFIVQGRSYVRDAAIFLVCKGFVELLRKGPQDPHAKAETCAILRVGSMFGTLPQKTIEPFTAIASSDDCEVYCLPAMNMKHLPDELLEQMQQRVSAETAHRLRSTCCRRPMGWDRHYRPKPGGECMRLMQMPARELQLQMIEASKRIEKPLKLPDLD